MLRPSAANDEDAFVALVCTNRQGLEFLYRDASGQSAGQQGPTVGGVFAPFWVQLAKSGDVYTASYSSDGTTWTTLGTHTADLGFGPSAGLVTCAHDPSKVATATFSDVAVTPHSLSDADVGSPAIAGSDTYDPATGTYTLTASGSDIWNDADAFNYAAQPFAGDGSITAEVTQAATNADGSAGDYAKAGVMFRDPNYADAPFVDLVYTNTLGLQLTDRAGNGQDAQQVGDNTPVSGPFWVRLSRDGTTYTGAYSTDGSTWTTVGTVEDDAVSYDGLAGLVACSHDDTQVATATFANVSTFAVDVVNPAEAQVAWTNPWTAASGTVLYGSTDGGSTYAQLADVPAGQSTFDLTGLTPQASYALDDVAAGSGATPNGTGAAAPNGGNAAPAATTTALAPYEVSVPQNLTQGIATNQDSGQTAPMHPIVFAASTLAAAQKADIQVGNFVSQPPNGPATTTFGMKVTKAGNTGHTQPANENSLAQQFNLSNTQLVVAVEDGSDADYNDAYSVITVTPITLDSITGTIGSQSQKSTDNGLTITNANLFAIPQSSGNSAHLDMAAQNLSPIDSVVKSHFYWAVARNPTDKLNGITPGISQNASDITKAKLQTNGAGSFNVICYLDTNGNGQYDPGEEVKVFHVAEIGVVVSSAEVNTTASNVHSYDDDFNTHTTSFISGSGGWTADNVPQTTAINFSATVTLQGGGADEQLGLSKVNLGWLQNVTSFSSSADYQDGSTETITTTAPLPLLDTANSGQGGATDYLSGTKLTDQGASPDGGEIIFVTAFDYPSSAYPDMQVKTNSTGKDMETKIGFLATLALVSNDYNLYYGAYDKVTWASRYEVHKR